MSFLLDWAYNRPDPRKALATIDDLLNQEVTLLHYDADCADEFGQIRVRLRRKGIEVPPLDLLIASVALVYDLTLVTNNTVDFQHIPGLRLDDWLTP